MIVKKPKETRITVDLTGPDGNAFCLMGLAMRLAKQVGKDGFEITQRMREKDYEHLLKVFDEEFGDFVTLYR